MQIVTTSKRTLQNKEFKQHLEDFELKVNLDENAMIELKQNRKVLNVKQELQRLKKNKRRDVGQEQEQEGEVVGQSRDENMEPANQQVE